MTETPVIEPPHPRPHSALVSLLRVMWHGDGNLLELLPGAAYRFGAGSLGYSRRSTVLFNDPALIEQILRDDGARFPKSDLMVNALEPLIGGSIFVTDGALWRRQRAMIDPAFTHMRIGHAFKAMQQSVRDHIAHWQVYAEDAKTFSLDLAMSHLTADVICRTTFSLPLTSQVALEVFDDFTVFERSVAQVDIFRLIFEPAWSDTPQTPSVLAACSRIRSHVGDLIDTHIHAPNEYSDIASDVIRARDVETGESFTRDQLIDQLGVFFLAGHETSASALTWAFYLLASQPMWADRVRAEVQQVTGGGDVEFHHIRQLPITRAFFKEVLRLYPPITFLPRVAMTDCRLGPRKLRRGALVMISPWTLHRHQAYWQYPNQFRPERFLPEAAGDIVPGSYIPFGQGPHTCIGAGFAQTEAILIIAELIRRFDIRLCPGQRVRPAARLTTRPASAIDVHCALLPASSHLKRSSHSGAMSR